MKVSLSLRMHTSLYIWWFWFLLVIDDQVLHHGDSNMICNCECYLSLSYILLRLSLDEIIWLLFDQNVVYPLWPMKHSEEILSLSYILLWLSLHVIIWLLFDLTVVYPLQPMKHSEALYFFNLSCYWSLAINQFTL